MFKIKLKELRENKGMSQAEFAADFGVTQSAVGNWESGSRKPNIDKIKKIADYFNVPVSVLIDDERRVKKATPTSPENRATRIPVYGCVAAGIPIEAIDNFDSTDPDDWEEIDEHMSKDGDYFALRIKGDSMEPKMSSGDVVIVRKQPDAESGDIAIVCINGDEATCKKIKKTPEGIMLISLNPAYEPMFYSKKQVEELPLTIIGRVVELRAKF